MSEWQLSECMWKKEKRTCHPTFADLYLESLFHKVFLQLNTTVQLRKSCTHKKVQKFILNELPNSSRVDNSNKKFYYDATAAKLPAGKFKGVFLQENCSF